MAVDIKGLSKEAVVAALYNNARARNPHTKIWTIRGARDLMHVRDSLGPATQLLFQDVYDGRMLHFDISGDSLDPVHYDEENGPGHAQRVIANLRATGSVAPID
jgi:hypothetical protein